jgi:hypothetical protein
MMIQVQMEVERGKLALEREKMMRSDDRERDKLEADIALKAAEINARYGAQVDMAQLRAQVDRDREAMRQQGQVARQMVGQQQMPPQMVQQNGTQPPQPQPPQPPMQPTPGVYQ